MFFSGVAERHALESISCNLGVPFALKHNCPFNSIMAHSGGGHDDDDGDDDDASLLDMDVLKDEGRN